MSVYDQAHLLAKDIRESSEYKRYKMLLEEIEKESHLKDMIDDFHQRQLELQKQQLVNNEITPEDEKKLHELLAVITKDPKASEFLEAEMRFAQMMADVSKILSEI
jgi:cell fate (sporulation/competence/biofilm development) regulator YlbF (YheA/YmcA/DUF963 family)